MASPAPAHPSFGEMTLVFLRIGLLGFGGPAGQIALMHRVLVEERRWISQDRFLHALNYCMLLPGPEAQQLATYVGWLLHRTRGGVVAGTLFVLPGFIVILALSIAYALFAEATWLQGVFYGLKAAVLVIVAEAMVRVARRALKNPAMTALAIAAFVALFAFNVSFPLVILAAAAIGYLGVRYRPDLLGASVTGAGAGDADDAFVEAPPAPGRAWRVIAVWGALWLAPFAIVIPLFGWSSVFVAIAGFFSQMAVVTFGGAYAVLAYVAQQAVDGFGWLRPGEMLDGLALAETTPGPLVLVLSFVGFMAGFRAPAGLDPMSAGILGAVLATWVTFIPCFLWIFLGAPFVERLRANRALAGALSAITAAVVGVIGNLALWFALHTLFRSTGVVTFGPLSFPMPDWQSLDLLALGLAAASALSLFVLRLGIIPTLGISAALGLISLLAG